MQLLLGRAHDDDGGDAAHAGRVGEGDATRRPPRARSEAEWRALADVARSAGGMPSSLLLAGRWLVERRAPALVAELERRTGDDGLGALLEGGLQELGDEDRSALLRLALHRGPLVPAVVDALVPERDPADVVASLRAAGALAGDALAPQVRERALDELAGRGTLNAARAAHADAMAALASALLDEATPVAPPRAPERGEPRAVDRRALADPSAPTRPTRPRFDPASTQSVDDNAREAAAARARAAALLGRLRPALEDAVEVLLRRAGAEREALALALALDAGDTRGLAPPGHVRILDEAVTRAGPRVDARLRARGLEARADHEKLAGKVHAARTDYLLALDLVDDARLTALLQRNIADLDLDAGELVAAEVHARRAVAAARRAADAAGMAKATWTLARIALKRGVIAEAELLLERAAAAFTAEGEVRFAARANFELGRCAEIRGDLAGARALFLRALEIHEADGDVAFAERARVHLGLNAAWIGSLDDARGYLESARASARARGDARAEAAVLAHLADLDDAAGDGASARALRHEADGLRALAR